MSIRTLLTTSLLVLYIGTKTPVAAQTDVKEQLVIPLTNPGSPGSIDVKLVNGSIHVVGYSGKEVVIDAVATARRTGKDETLPGNNAGMKRISSGNQLSIDAEEKDNHIKVNSDSWKRAIDLTIKVPQRFSLKLSTVNNGDVQVENVNGKLEISNVNGPIQLTNIAGSVVANTVNGNVVTTFKSVNADEPMAFSTLNGSVDVTFPASVKASVKMKSDRGDLFTDFDIDVDKNQPKTNRTAQSGMYPRNGRRLGERED